MAHLGHVAAAPLLACDSQPVRHHSPLSPGHLGCAVLSQGSVPSCTTSKQQGELGGDLNPTLHSRDGTDAAFSGESVYLMNHHIIYCLNQNTFGLNGDAMTDQEGNSPPL